MQSAVAGTDFAELALVEGEQPVVAIEQATKAALSITSESNTVAAVTSEQLASITTVADAQPVAAVMAADSVNIGLIADDPGLAAVGMPSQTMVAVSPAPRFEIATGAFLTIAALPITTSREVTTRTTQSVVNLGLPNSLTVAAAI